jgi:NAD(P)-dependent dehydrogenase (short-subunit alcohol dehydrogenase family)
VDRFTDRTVVITGGGSGIGKATAVRVAAEGAKVVIVDMNPDAGNAVAEEVGGIAVQADVTEAADVARMFQTAFDTYGSIDVSFHNAGISPPDDDSILTTGIEAWDRVQRVNLTSVYLCCKEVIPYMQRQGKGSIINTASFVATMGAATSQISYTASKGGVLAMSRELGVQFAREGIRVNALSPARPHPVRPLRRAERDRRGRGVPRQRRQLLHHRQQLPGRRRHLRRLRHTSRLAHLA